MPVTRDASQDLRFNVHPGLVVIHDPPVIWSVEHESGCWLFIREVGPAMLIQWKTMPTYMARPVTVEAHCPTLDAQANLATAIVRCEELLKAGPSAAVLAKKETEQKHRKEGGKRGYGAKAERDLARKGADDYDFLTGPRYDAKKWQWSRQEDYRWPSFLLAYQKTPNTCIVLDDKKNDGNWSVLRGWWSNDDPDTGANLTDQTPSNMTWPEACALASKLARSNPADWTKGNIASFV